MSRQGHMQLRRPAASTLTNATNTAAANDRLMFASLKAAITHNIIICNDPHQDVWSRWTGGDGPPLWILEMVVFDVDNLRCCEAAVCQETYGTGSSSKEVGGQNTLPKMMWPTNYLSWQWLPCYTFSVVEDRKNTGSKMNIHQTFLQSHYINAMAELMKYLKGLDNIVPTDKQLN
eukprot:scaffold22125_cov97-Cyclotella_meneghiniana.AAC.1